MKSLKNLLIKHNITSYSDLKKHKNIKIKADEVRKNFKYKPWSAVIKYILRGDLKCICGSGLDVTWNPNTDMYRTSCRNCIIRDNSEQIKASRARETEYSGEILVFNEIKKQISQLDIEKYLGSGKQRTFIKQHNKLYFSIMSCTSNLDSVVGISLRGRIDYINNPSISITCSCGKISAYNNSTYKFKKYCNSCTPRYPKLNYFIEKYGKHEGHNKYDENAAERKIKSKGMFSLDWFTSKYGCEGQNKYDAHYKKLFDSRTNEPYSKISQKLFWELDRCGFEGRFAEKNSELNINLNKEDKKIYGDSKKVRINLDYVYNKKIIEFNGTYWHKSQEQRDIDIKRRKVCENKGYEVLFVWEDEYRKHPKAVTDRCIRFLQSSNAVYNDRYSIETSEGYVSFDNVINTGSKSTLVFKTTNTKIEVSNNHTFVVGGHDIVAKTMNVGDYLEVDGNLEVVESISSDNNTVYDILGSSTNTYIANKVNNHNCSFLGSSHTLLSTDTLKNLKAGDVINTLSPGLKMYHKPKKGHQYICAVDAAKDGADSFALQIVDITNFKFQQVASAKLDVDYLIMPEIIEEWVQMYNNAFLIIENNEGAGQSVADQMYLTYEYENLYFDKQNQSSRKKKKYPGFRTTTKSRKLIIKTMKTFIENRNLEVNNQDTIDEFFTFILEKGKYQADEGCHDDMIMSLALVFAPFCDSKNFEDMKAIVDVIFKDHEDSEDIEVSDMLVIGSFDDATDMNELYENQTSSTPTSLE